MKKILFVVDDRNMGGVSIVLEDILNNINLKNSKIDLLVLNNTGSRLKKIPKNITIIEGTKFFKSINVSFNSALKGKDIKSLALKIYLTFLLKTNLIKYKIRKERKKILKSDYDIEIAFKYGFVTLFTYYGDSLKKINWIHNDVSNNDPAFKYRGVFKKILSEFDLNVLLSDNLERAFKRIYSVNNTIVINNVIDDKKILELSKKTNYIQTKNINILSIGRLNKIKCYAELIQTFNRLKQENILHNVQLSIIGDGEEKEHLLELIKAYDLENNIRLLGEKDNPYPFLKIADLFILPSKSEAYPTVVIESLMCGTPVLSTNTISISEMLNESYGFITNNIYEALISIINNRELLVYKREALKKYKYNNKKIINKIEEILK
ncbi:MAG: glycosyltransferase [Bacilli bacterium]|nr:glycosyltransferase [Bacilli bacterium]